MFKNKKVRWILIIVAVIVVLGIVAKACGFVGGKKEMQVAIEKPSKRDITQTVNASGTIYPEVEVKVSSDVSGEITELYIQEGDSVKAGQLLAKIKPEIYQSYVERSDAAYQSALAAIESAKAGLDQANAAFDKAKADYDRQQKLYNEHIISVQDWNTAQANYKNAKAQVSQAKENVQSAKFNANSAKANVKESQGNLSKTIITAPMSGIVSKLNVEKGERVVGTSQMAGTEMLRVADFRTFEVRVNVNENDVIKIHEGDSTNISLDAYPDRKFKGIVTKIANSSSNASTDQATTFVVRIKILPASYADLLAEHPKARPFRPGMNAAVEILVKTVKNVLSVPIQCLTLREDSMRANYQKKADAQLTVVFVVKNGKIEQKVVKAGIQNELYYEIQSGLAPEDEVVVAPYTAISRLLKAGMPVKVVSKELLTDKGE